MAALRALAARIPRRIVESANARYKDIERTLLGRTRNVEEVEEQRKFIEALPMKIAELRVEVTMIIYKSIILLIIAPGWVLFLLALAALLLVASPVAALL